MRGRSRAPTITDVAQAAGVDRSSVSRAFRHPELLSPQTVGAIKAAADRLGYIPNHSARALSTGRHGNIALIVPDIADPFFALLIRAAQAEADRSDTCIFLGNSDEDTRQEERLLERFAGQVEGFVLASPQLPDDEVLSAARLRPLVLVNRDVPGVPRVLIDSGSGIEEAISHLSDLGHRRVAYVSGPAASWTNKRRRSAARKAAARLGLDLVNVQTQLSGYEAGRQAAAELLRTAATAVLAYDDTLAQGVVAGLAERKVGVPGDIAVVACDDVRDGATYPPLTAISNRSAEAGRTAVSLLAEVLGSDAVQDARYVLETHLIVRDSSAGAHAKVAEPG